MGRKTVADFHYILLNKPYGVLSQFTDAAGRQTLKHLGPFPGDVYPAGRLDADSEGLLLLTNDNDLKHFLTDPRYGHPRTYVVQVEGLPTQEEIAQLRKGVILGGRRTQPADVRLLQGEPAVPPRPVPIRFRKSVPTSWIELTIREGRNRQIRKMTAGIGHPTLRLLRIHIGRLSIAGLAPGQWRILTRSEIATLKKP